MKINFGSLFENYVACELCASGVKAYYYKSVKIGEIDFVAELNGTVLPIEVKSGNNYKKHKALDNLLQCPEYSLQSGIVLSTNNLEQAENILYCPIYMAPLLQENKPEDAALDLHIFS